ncbi:unnamed protein product [Cochlearia groenlandica]
MDYTMKMQRCQALVEEQKKIQVFKRELPLCLELITQAIEECRKDLSELSTSEKANGLSECSERTMSECGGDDGGGVAVFEELFPIKRSSSSSDEHESCVRDEDEVVAERIAAGEDNGDKIKSDWLNLGSVQSPDPHTATATATEKTVVLEVIRNGGAFQPFQKEKAVAAKSDSQPMKPTVTTSSSTAETGGSKRETEQMKQSHMHRKQRRCWSPELHRRFLHALQKLGGSHVATPKQIRDLMKVDGLTNDEVKSHLQKYRLHTRRPSTSTATISGEQPQPPQFMAVEGNWVPSPSHDGTSNRVYTPVAAKPPQASPSGERSNRRCKSPATSSTHTQHVLSLS